MIFGKLCNMISEQFNVEEDTLELTTSFMEDLNADSLDLVELMMSIEEEFELPEMEEGTLDQIKTIGDAVNMIKEVIGE